MSYDRNKVIKIAEAEINYLEKRDGNLAYLYDKTANAGSKNYTKYGKEMHDIYPTIMDYPAAWCDAFVDWCFMQAYGVCNARALIGGEFNDYTVDSAQLYKNKNAWKPKGVAPEPGWQIFFTNGTRIYHTGLVVGYNPLTRVVTTIEGNTSSAAGVVENGGCVQKKEYSVDYAKIAGYGVPAYNDGQFGFTPHWVRADGKWYYRKKEGENAHGWETINHHWYYFDESGEMLKGWQQIGDEIFFLEESGDFEGACWHEAPGNRGALERWYVESE